MPKLLFARPPVDAEEERQIRKPAGARHASADWIMRAQMIVSSRQGLRTSAIAAKLGCHMQTVRERIERFNAEGLDGLADRPGVGRKPRIPASPSRKCASLRSPRVANDLTSHTAWRPSGAVTTLSGFLWSGSPVLTEL
ncbi:helix-turn-helix domain-containing protein [Streptosporangium canum]|uniref:helix-turn-helix domain-containing protein n=1 Tax=Streptosporangium canum TaxID=324952 RepID=UPI00341DEEDE